MTKRKESDHLERIAAQGCIACRKLGMGYRPAEAHHTRFAAGAGQRSGTWFCIPLCPEHHRLGKTAYHASPKRFEMMFGTEEALLDETLERCFK